MMPLIIFIVAYVALGVISFILVHHHDNPDQPYIYRDIFFFLLCIIGAPAVFAVTALLLLAEHTPREDTILNKNIFRRKE